LTELTSFAADRETDGRMDW